MACTVRSVDLMRSMQFFERGWLSANNIVFQDAQGATVVDTGYCTHAAQTVALVEHALAGQPLARIINTHLHSDHCGGNAALQARYPQARTHIPPWHSAAVAVWDETVLTYRHTAQECPRFQFDALIQPGDAITLGGQTWQALAALGHDPHSIMLYCPAERILLSADALWENGFGVVFPELEGAQAFDEVAATLRLIETLRVDLVIPGHGAPFTDCAAALARAHKRLDAQVQNPAKHAWHAAKVLVMYRMMAGQRVNAAQLQDQFAAAYLFQEIARRWFKTSTQELFKQACQELMLKKQLVQEGEDLVLSSLK
jgi:glyoxylase-like metal-dependent hydrolase (beta-lactamase superfamily II)